MTGDTKETVARRAGKLLDRGYHCSEGFVLAVGEHLLGGVNEQLQKAATAFSGGIGRANRDICGALSGGIMILGALYGRTTPDVDEMFCCNLAVKYREAFAEKFSSINCIDLHGEGDQYYGSRGGEPCSVLVERAALIFLSLLEEEGLLE